MIFHIVLRFTNCELLKVYSDTHILFTMNEREDYIFLSGREGWPVIV